MLPQSYQYQNLSEGADRVGGQLRGDKECPFSGVTKSGRVWRKVPESDARSVGPFMIIARLHKQRIACEQGFSSLLALIYHLYRQKMTCERGFSCRGHWYPNTATCEQGFSCTGTLISRLHKQRMACEQSFSCLVLLTSR